MFFYGRLMHVFIVHGDLTRIACDAWLMPCGIDAKPGPHWLTDIETNPFFRWPAPPVDWSITGRRCIKLHNERQRGPNGSLRPIPWLVNVGGGRRQGIEWFVDGVRAFMECVALDEDLQQPLNGRARPLVALPIVGTGYGGARMRAGLVVRALLPCLYECAREHGIDIALVVKDQADYAAAQRERLSYQQAGQHRWPELGRELRGRAEKLAERASAGELVVFLGSGVSRGAGLPTWGAFLRQLAEQPEQQMEIEWEELARWNYTDQARIIERGFGGRERLGEAIARCLERRNYSLSHAFLAGLPTLETVTTNYDTLFEMASASIDKPVAVLPYEPVRPEERWILKMHGCISHPEDIVLTREDYLRYTERRRALAGVVQALLITKHMMFVGFSLDDDNFHRIADDVRKIVWANERGEPFGTSIVLDSRPFLAQMWDGEIEMVVVDEGEHRGGVPGSVSLLAERARKLEIFLDYLLAQVADPNHLLNARFAHLLTEDEAALSDTLHLFIASTTPQMRQTAAWAKIQRLLTELGWSPRR